MSYANGTPFLNLAQTVGTDHRDWFDENAAKLDLDTKMKTLWDGAADTATILSALQESVGELQTDVTTLEGVVSGHTSTITTINESLVLINTALNALNTQVTNKFDSAGIADPYDATHGIYAVGDVVTYNGQRYVCSTAVTAAEPFDVSKWTAEDIQTVIDQLSVSPIASVTADGVKTFAQLFTELNTLVTNSGKTLDLNSKLVIDGAVFNCEIPTSRKFTRVDGNVTTEQIYVVHVDLVNANIGTMQVLTTGNNFVDQNSNVLASGKVITVY